MVLTLPVGSSYIWDELVCWKEILHTNGPNGLVAGIISSAASPPRNVLVPWACSIHCCQGVSTNLECDRGRTSPRNRVESEERSAWFLILLGSHDGGNSFVVGNPVPIIGNLDFLKTKLLRLNDNLSWASIDSIFDQLFNYAGRTLDHFSCCNLVGKTSGNSIWDIFSPFLNDFIISLRKGSASAIIPYL